MPNAPENLSPEADASAPDPARRNWLRGMVAAPIAAGALSTVTRPAKAAGKVATKAHIVIVDSGLGGIAVAIGGMIGALLWPWLARGQARQA